MIQEANLHWRYIDTDTSLIMPWYTLPALQWLIKQDIKKWEVFEYGCGYSTIWWRTKCRSVDSIDHDVNWANAIGSVNIIQSDKNSYVKFIDYLLESTSSEMGFDCIVVDGEWRNECIEHSRSLVAHGGFMIVDNYGQDGFPPKEIIDQLLEGWEKQVFKQPNHTDWATAVFKKP